MLALSAVAELLVSFLQCIVRYFGGGVGFNQ